MTEQQQYKYKEGQPLILCASDHNLFNLLLKLFLLLHELKYSNKPGDFNKLIQLTNLGNPNKTIDVIGCALIVFRLGCKYLNDHINGQNREKVDQEPRLEVLLSNLFPIVYNFQVFILVCLIKVKHNVNSKHDVDSVVEPKVPHNN